MMTTQLGAVVAPASSDTIGSPESDVLYLDPDIAALFAAVDAILCAALTPNRCPPAPPVTRCALNRGRSAGRSCGALVRPRRAAVHPVRAVQRGPPSRRTAATNGRNPSERQVMASQQT